MAGSIEKLGDGRWYVRVELDMDVRTGRRKRLSKVIHGTKKDAEKFLTAKLRDRDLGELTLPTKITLKEHTEAWLEKIVKIQARENTFLHYKRILNIYALPYLGSARLEALKPETMQAHCAELVTLGLSERTIRHVFTILKACLEQAVEWDRLARNPIRRIKFPPKAKRERKTTLDPTRVKEFLEEVAQGRHGALLVLAIVSGMRPGEQQGLMWQDIDWDRNLVRVCRAVEWIAANKEKKLPCRWAIKEPKTEAGRRTIPMPEFVMDMLKKHRARQAEQRLLLGEEWENHGFIFTNEFGRPFNRRRISDNHLKPALKRLGLPSLTYYDLRHVMPSLLMAEGKNPKIVAERMGHSTVAITLDVYSHTSPGMQQEVVDTLDELLNPARKPASGTARRPSRKAPKKPSSGAEEAVP